MLVIVDYDAIVKQNFAGNVVAWRMLIAVLKAADCDVEVLYSNRDLAAFKKGHPFFGVRSVNLQTDLAKAAYLRRVRTSASTIVISDIATTIDHLSVKMVAEDQSADGDAVGTGRFVSVSPLPDQEVLVTVGPDKTAFIRVPNQVDYLIVLIDSRSRIRVEGVENPFVALPVVSKEQIASADGSLVDHDVYHLMPGRYTMRLAFSADASRTTVVRIRSSTFSVPESDELIRAIQDSSDRLLETNVGKESIVGNLETGHTDDASHEGADRPQ